MTVSRHDADPEAISDSRDTSQRNWTFLTNHASVLLYVAAHSDAKVRAIGDAVGLMERATAAIIADLRRAGYIAARRVGRHNEYSVNLQMPLRRPYHARSNVGDLLATLHVITGADADDPHVRPSTPADGRRVRAKDRQKQQAPNSSKTGAVSSLVEPPKT